MTPGQMSPTPTEGTRVETLTGSNPVLAKVEGAAKLGG
jgi:hypothetical protein